MLRKKLAQFLAPRCVRQQNCSLNSSLKLSAKLSVFGLEASARRFLELCSLAAS